MHGLDQKRCRVPIYRIRFRPEGQGVRPRWRNETSSTAAERPGFAERFLVERVVAADVLHAQGVRAAGWREHRCGSSAKISV